ACASENDEPFDIEVDDDEEGFIHSSIGGDICNDNEEDLDDTGTEDILGVNIALIEKQKVAKRALTKLRNGIVKIRRSQGLFETFMMLTKTGDSPKGLSPLLDVRTRWGSTFTMIEHAIQCKNAYNTMLLDA
ncbi:hypothetical protein CPC16_005306, partial [Podila verticillata]